MASSKQRSECSEKLNCLLKDAERKLEKTKDSRQLMPKAERKAEIMETNVECQFSNLIYASNISVSKFSNETFSMAPILI